MTDIEQARQIVKDQLAKGTPEKQIRETMWNSGYTQAEMDGAFSGTPSTAAVANAMRPAQAASGGSKITVIALAAIVVIAFTVMPFVIPKPGTGGEKMTLAQVDAYGTLLEQKAAQEGGLKYDITMNSRSGTQTIAASGTVYMSKYGETRTEAVVTSSGGYYGSSTQTLLIISNDTGSYTRHESDYLNPAPYWTRSSEDPLDTESSLEDVDYYNQGRVDCGAEKCMKIYANYQGIKMTILMRDDGFQTLVEVESPTESIKIEQKNPVFGPLDESLFSVPAGESIEEESPLYGLY